MPAGRANAFAAVGEPAGGMAGSASFFARVPRAAGGRAMKKRRQSVRFAQT